SRSALEPEPPPVGFVVPATSPNQAISAVPPTVSESVVFAAVSVTPPLVKLAVALLSPVRPASAELRPLRVETCPAAVPKVMVCVDPEPTCTVSVEPAEIPCVSKLVGLYVRVVRPNLLRVAVPPTTIESVMLAAVNEIPPLVRLTDSLLNPDSP